MKQVLPVDPLLPTGTVTFLFTDIQGSTPLWEQRPQAMAAALQIHNASLRGVIEANGGVVFKTMGDAFQAAFATAPQALKAAIDGQQALQVAPWNELGPLKVRMGLHTGEAQLDPGGDEYAVSHTKNRIGRIHSIAHGGQILLSQETADQVLRVLPEGVSLKDLGEHRLKGLQWTERLYQVCAPGLPSEFPPLSTAITHPNNLPVQLTSFVGREKEIAAVKQMLRTSRLVTLTGPGGTGKTRLALAVGQAMVTEFEHGVWLVDLAPLGDPSLVVRTTSQTLNVHEVPGISIGEVLTGYLENKCLLLILDNCEHLLADCASLADSLLKACPQLYLLCTSREILGITGETTFHVPPLGTPDPKHLPAIEQIGQFDAMRLFAERAGSAMAGFVLNEENAASVASICQRLDGIPLALELAAARIRLMSASQIAARLDNVFHLLTSGSRNVQPRQQTLKATMEWSYALLTDAEKLALQRLSVFAGSCTLEAAESVVCGEEIEEFEVLDLLAGLVDKSLIQSISTAEGTNRFLMLGTLRQYAQEKLVDAKEAEVVRSRHLDYYLRLAEALEPMTRGGDQIQILNRLELELDNLRPALEWALQTNVDSELRLAASLQWFWHIHSRKSEGIQWLERGLETDEKFRQGTSEYQAHTLVRAKALSALGFFHLLDFINGEPTLDLAKKALEESLSFYRGKAHEKQPGAQPEDQKGLAWTLLWLGYCKKQTDEAIQVQPMVQEAMELFKEHGDLHGIDESLQLMALCEPDRERRLQLHQEQLAVAKTAEDLQRIAGAFLCIGHVHLGDGNYREACMAYEACFEYNQRVGNTENAGTGMGFAGFAAACLGDRQCAKQYNQQSLAISRELGDENRTAFSLILGWELAVSEGFFDQAAEMSDEAWRIYQKTGNPLIAAHVLCIRAKLARLRGQFDAARRDAEQALVISDKFVDMKMVAILELGYLAFNRGDMEQASSLWLEGIRMRDDPKNLPFISLLEALSYLAARKNHKERAVLLFGTRWSQAGFNFLSPGERALRETFMTEIKASLGEERYKALFEEGQHMTLEQAVTLALEKPD